MSATAAPLVRMLPGPAGSDSPTVAAGLPAAFWGAWLRIGEDRARSRTTPREVLAVALDADLDASSWPRWWDRAHPEGTLTHRAAVLHAPGGAGTLLSRCGHSQPWLGPGIGLWGIGDPEERDDTRTYCARCVSDW